MSLLDAPEFDVEKEKRKRNIFIAAASAVLVLVLGFWLVAGHPVAWPWQWMTHLRGRMATNAFFEDLERNDLAAAYGVWQNDKNWQKHPQRFSDYSFARFQKDWSGNSPDNDYGVIHKHRIAAARISGNVLMLGVFVNDRKSHAVNLDYDPYDHTLSFAPDTIQFYEGPGGIS